MRQDIICRVSFLFAILVMPFQTAVDTVKSSWFGTTRSPGTLVPFVNQPDNVIRGCSVTVVCTKCLLIKLHGLDG